MVVCSALATKFFSQPIASHIFAKALLAGKAHRHFLNARLIYISSSILNCCLAPLPDTSSDQNIITLTLLIKCLLQNFKTFFVLGFFVCPLWSLMASEPCLGWPLQMMWSHATFVTPCHFFINSNECLFWG